jgi:predicted nucleic acid-binding protein
MSDRRVYLDSCVFLSYVNNYAQRAPTIDCVLGEGRANKIALFTSELTIVEVAFGAMEQVNRKLDAETEERIDKLWLPGSPISLIEYYRLIGEDARGLMRAAMEKGWKLRAYDALHLSTARKQEVTEFYTYDDKLPKYADIVGFTICEPYTRNPTLDYGLAASAPPP